MHSWMWVIPHLFDIHCKHLLGLSARWANPLVSTACFHSMEKEATSLATTLLGLTLQISLLWVNRKLLEVPEPSLEEDLTHMEPTPNREDDGTNIVLADYLTEVPQVPNEEELEDAQGRLCHILKLSQPIQPNSGPL
ncbi:hypothetical protein BS17DRAFT_811886 [Gyrodon lividus]|nr:hypothetical protein BS17DRAFT_811886 [Gyrodon lividus]